mmetsp:Transcript_11969/g.37898  ORF Transcript_11969/g.37898 Transcript_11969/m.37898 type:complete len:215 (-) Transcript_11969:4-648(-)
MARRTSLGMTPPRSAGPPAAGATTSSCFLSLKVTSTPTPVSLEELACLSVAYRLGLRNLVKGSSRVATILSMAAYVSSRSFMFSFFSAVSRYLNHCCPLKLLSTYARSSALQASRKTICSSVIALASGAAWRDPRARDAARPSPTRPLPACLPRSESLVIAAEGESLESEMEARTVNLLARTGFPLHFPWAAAVRGAGTRGLAHWIGIGGAMWW